LAGLARRAGGWAARWGGDEFVLVLPEATDWAAFGAELLSLLDDHADRHKWPEPVTVSGGAVFWKRAKANFQTLLSRADRMLYRAKEEGRARFVLRSLYGARGASGARRRGTLG